MSWLWQPLPPAAAVGAGAFTLIADSGSYTITGTTASLLAARKLVIDSGTYLVTGTVANLLAARKIIVDSGIYNIIGTAANLVFSGAVEEIIKKGVQAMLHIKQRRRVYRR